MLAQIRYLLLEVSFKLSKLKAPVMSIFRILVSYASDMGSSRDDRTSGVAFGGL